MVKQMEKQKLAIEGLQADNTSLRADLAALKASPAAPTLQAPAAVAESGFTHTDAA
jgi:hypothetical protein